MDQGTVVIIIAVAANLVATVTGVVALLNRISEEGRWRGKIDTKVRAHCDDIRQLKITAQDHEKRISKHEGELGGGIPASS